MLTQIKRCIRGCWFFVWGNLFAFFFYDRHYLQGRWFQGKIAGLCASGWEWIVQDVMARIILHKNVGIPFPISSACSVICPENLHFHPDDLNNFQSSGIYCQAIGSISIGKGTYIAPNVGLITANHTVEDLQQHDSPRSIILGEQCWIGMNTVILPGVHLGSHTIVGAGSIVTKSYPEGHCIIAGNPAKLIRKI